MSVLKNTKQGFQAKNAGLADGFTPVTPPADAVLQHAQVPVCRTFHGCIEHVAHLSLRRRWALAFALKCEPDQVPRKLYHLAKGGIAK